MRTYSPKPTDISRQWHLIDAEGKILGRLAQHIAQVLMGKGKPIYARHMDTGDYVIAINAEKVQVTGRKREQKLYYRHTGYPGGLRSTTMEKMLATHPERVLRHAVRGMLPHNTLGRHMLRKLKIYAGPTHPHQAQIHAKTTPTVMVEE